MIELRANLIADTGRKNNLLIPPNSLRWVKSGYFTTGLELSQNVYVVLSNDELMLKSIFVPNHMLKVKTGDGAIMVPLYNGSSQSFYVQDEMIIAVLLIYPGMVE